MHLAVLTMLCHAETQKTESLGNRSLILLSLHSPGCRGGMEITLITLMAEKLLGIPLWQSSHSSSRAMPALRTLLLLKPMGSAESRARAGNCTSHTKQDAPTHQRKTHPAQHPGGNEMR